MYLPKLAVDISACFGDCTIAFRLWSPFIALHTIGALAPQYRPIEIKARSRAADFWIPDRHSARASLVWNDGPMMGKGQGCDPPRPHPTFGIALKPPQRYHPPRWRTAC